MTAGTLIIDGCELGPAIVELVRDCRRDGYRPGILPNGDIGPAPAGDDEQADLRAFIHELWIYFGPCAPTLQ